MVKSETVEWIPCGKLERPGYQREVIETHPIKQSDFSLPLSGVLYVFDRNRRFYVGDGLQRKTAAQEQHGPDFELRCLVYRGYSNDDEMIFFKKWNGDRRNVSKTQLFLIDAERGVEDNVNILDIVKRNGFSIGPGPGRPLNFSGVGALKRIYNYGADNKRPDVLYNVLRIMKGAYGENAYSSNNQMCEAVFYLIQKYEIDADTLVKFLSDSGKPTDIAAKAATTGDGQEGRIALYIAHELNLKPKSELYVMLYRTKSLASRTINERFLTLCNENQSFPL